MNHLKVRSVECRNTSGCLKLVPGTTRAPFPGRHRQESHWTQICPHEEPHRSPRTNDEARPGQAHSGLQTPRLLSRWPR